jgi:predicted dinucleotide-utilizing enzyme
MTTLQVRHALKIAVIGFGAIGSFVVEHLIAEPTFDVVGVLSKPPPASKPRVQLFDDIDALLGTQPDVVVECAGHQALREVGELVLRKALIYSLPRLALLPTANLRPGSTVQHP